MNEMFEEGAYVPPSGDPTVSTEVKVWGSCGYCEGAVWSIVDTLRSGMTVGRGETVFVGIECKPWHVACFNFANRNWTVNAAGKVHLHDCRYAEPDGEHVRGTTRGELLVTRCQDDFCKVCAPFAEWLAWPISPRNCPLTKVGASR